MCEMKFDLSGESRGYVRLGGRDCTVIALNNGSRVDGLYTGMYAEMGGAEWQIVSYLRPIVNGKPVEIAIEGKHEPEKVMQFSVRPIRGADALQRI
jgi:hypothetical protein